MKKTSFHKGELVTVSNDGKTWFKAFYIRRGGAYENGHWCYYDNEAHQKLWKYCERGQK